MRLPSFLRAAALVAGAVVATAPLASQDASPPRRLKMADTGLPGIDLGLAPSARFEAIGGRERLRAQEARSLPYVAGRVLVKFRNGEHAETVAIDPAADPEATARLYAARGDVEFAQADYRAHYDFRPNDPLFANQWNLSALRMEQAWDVNPGATSSVIVAVLDGGMAYDTATYQYNTFAVSVGARRYPALGRVTIPFAAAPELAGPNRFVAPRDFIWNDNAPVDLDGHGTHVAGTIGQLTNNAVGVAGMAFNVRLMPVKVLGGDWDFIFDAPNEATTSIVASGIRYAADNGANVINMSLGFDGGGPLPAIEEAMRYAVGKGVFIAVSAGNGFEDGNPEEAVAEIAAKLDGVMSVGAVGRNLDRAFYSSSRSSVEIAAPGGDFRVGGNSGGVIQQTYDPITSAVDPLSSSVTLFHVPRYDVFSYEAYQGTSMSAPHVAGLAALLVQQGITKPQAIEAAIKRFATDRGAAGRDNDFGFGLISPRETLRGLGLSR
ncbi:MAG: S8 family serine peptidase [Vicinamibacteraceae bacterium]